MKNAFEAFLETSLTELNNQCKKEKEIELFKKEHEYYSSFWCENLIQSKIDNAIKRGLTNITIELMTDSIRSKVDGSHYLSYRLLKDFNRGIWNSNAKGYFEIPHEPGYILSLNGIKEILLNANYKVNISTSTIKEANTRTGKYGCTRTTYLLTISWDF